MASARIDRLIRAYALLYRTARSATDPRVQRLQRAFDLAREQLTPEDFAVYWQALQAYWRDCAGDTEQRRQHDNASRSRSPGRYVHRAS